MTLDDVLAACREDYFLLRGARVFGNTEAFDLFFVGDDADILGHDSDDAYAWVGRTLYAEVHALAARLGTSVKSCGSNIRVVGLGLSRRGVGFR